MSEMKGKRVLVTGAGTGIGKGVGLAFARSGADVVFHYCHASEGAEAAAAEAKQSGVRAEAMGADFNDVDAVRDLAAQAEEMLGGIDVLVNNAGITTNLPFHDVTVEQFDTLYNVNIRAMYFLTQAVTRGMADRGRGVVINLTSVHANHALTEHSIYAGTKGAIVSFTRTLSVEMALKGIRVNAIAPGWILVENHLKVISNFDESKAAYDIPAGFIGRPHDVAELALFLASDCARYIVGQTFTIDGGQMCIMANAGDFHHPGTDRFGQGYVAGT